MANASYKFLKATMGQNYSTNPFGKKSLEETKEAKQLQELKMKLIY